MTSNSLTVNKEHGIPSQILKTIFGLHASVIIWTPICVVSSTFEGSSDPPLMRNSSGQLAELIVYVIPPEQIYIVAKSYWYKDSHYVMKIPITVRRRRFSK